MNWRTDLENVPKDGTKILAYDSRNKRVDVVKWFYVNEEVNKRKDWVMPWTWHSWDDPLEIFNSFDQWCEIILP